MSDTVKILVKEVRLSQEQKGLKLVTASIGTEPAKVYKFSELKQDQSPRKGWAEIKEGEFTCYINGEYIASAYPVQAQGFKGGGNKYTPNPQTQREIIRQNCITNAVNLYNTYASGKFDIDMSDRISETIKTAKQFESWVREGNNEK